MKFKTQALALFLKHTSYHRTNIWSCQRIHKGFTNVSYKITTVDRQAFQVRIANDCHIVNRKNESKIYQKLHQNYFLYFDLRTGNAIKKWISGKNPDKSEINSPIFLKSFVKSLKQLRQIEPKGFLKHNYFDCLSKAKLPLKHKQAYLQLIENYKDLPLVLSHNDLSADNLIYTNQHQVIFIDYEWSRLNNVYWDVANFIREVNLPIVAIKYLCKALKINLQSLLVFVYLCTNYAYQWTFNMLQTKKIKLYRQQIFKKLEHYYQLAKIGEYTHL